MTTRMFTHTGPRRGDVFAESTFAKQIAMIEHNRIPPVVKVGNLQSLRTVADVRDAVRAYYMLVTVNPTPGAYYNIGGSHSCTVKDILDTLISFSPCKPDIQRRGRPRSPAPDRRRPAGAEHRQIPGPYRLEARRSLRQDPARPAGLLAGSRGNGRRPFSDPLTAADPAASRQSERLMAFKC